MRESVEGACYSLRKIILHTKINFRYYVCKFFGIEKEEECVADFR